MIPDDKEDDEELDEFEEDDGDDVALHPMTSAAQESEAEQEEEFFGSSRRRKSAAAGERREPLQLWLISYSDFMTILFVFFLVMYGYANLAHQKAAQAIGASMSYESFSKLMGTLQHQVGERNMDVKEDKRKITLQLKDKILFQSGRADLTAPARSTLEELAKSLKLVEGDVIVEGHTDNVPVTGGKYHSNWELSAARAFSVIQAMTDSGVPQKRLAAWGFGENRPLVPNDKEENRAMNRRIDVIIFKKTPHAKEV